MNNNQTNQETSTDHGRAEAIGETGRLSIRFEDLPQDVLYKIVSKLPSNEFARTRVLSSRWRSMWSLCPRLTFDGVEVCKCARADLHQHIGIFIHKVNTILQKHLAKVVETLEVRIDFVDSQQVHHLNSLVSFAVSSRTKNITFDLKPRWFCWESSDRYVFPFELLDSGSISRLQHLELSFASFKPPVQFRGFPYLRKLHLQLLHASRKDLEHVLCHCYNLEWLRIGRYDLNDELTVDGTLSRLVYLRIECCKLTKIRFHAVNLATFEYEGSFIPIDLSHSLNLESVNIDFDKGVFQHALVSLLNGIPNARNLTFCIGWQHLEKQCLWDNPLRFSYLRHLQLIMLIFPEDVDKVLYLVSFLRVTPFIEKLEVHFAGHSLWLADLGPSRHDLGLCKYKYLKNMWITGFKAARGQLEFLLHIVENAPALEVLTVETRQRRSREIWKAGGSGPPFEEVKQIARTCLGKSLAENVKLCVI